MSENIEEILKDAKIIGYYQERMNSYICLDKNGKHYILFHSAELDWRNSLYTELFDVDVVYQGEWLKGAIYMVRMPKAVKECLNLVGKNE